MSQAIDLGGIADVLEAGCDMTCYILVSHPFTELPAQQQLRYFQG